MIDGRAPVIFFSTSNHHLYITQHIGGKRSELSKTEREDKLNTKPPAASKVEFSEIVPVRFSLANNQTKALLTGEITKMSLLTLLVTSMKSYKSLKICRKSIMDRKAFRPESTAFDPDNIDTGVVLLILSFDEVSIMWYAYSPKVVLSPT